LKGTRWILSAVLAATGAALGAPEARAADPLVLGVAEAEAPDTGDRVLVVYGLLVTKIKTYELRETDGTPIAPLAILFKSKNLATLALPVDLAMTQTVPGPFTLHYTFGKASTGDVDINITNGAPAPGSVTSSVLSPALLTDLHDAATVGGEAPSALHDWNNLTNVPAGFADGTDDSVTFGGNGVATTASRSDHDHDARYFTETELSAPGGMINDPSNPIDWSRLKNVPLGFADGTDDGGGGSYSAGAGLVLSVTTFSANFTASGGDNGTATTVARGDHLHDGRYYTESELNSAGTINTGSNPVDWTKLKGVPAGFADNVDNDTTYSAGSGIGIASNVISVSFGGSGTATTVSRSDHTHTGFVGTTGSSTVSGSLTINSTGTALLATSGNTGTTGGIDSTTSNGIGVAGTGNVGVLGDCDSNGAAGVAGLSLAGGYYQNGVYAYAYENSSTALYAYHFYYGYAVDAHSWGATALRARVSSLSYGNVVYVDGTNYGSSVTGVYANIRGYSARGSYFNVYGQYANGHRTYVSGYSSQGSSTRVGGTYARGAYLGVYGYRSTGMQLYAGGTYATGLSVQVYGKNSQPFIVNSNSPGGYSDLAIFRRYGTNYARIGLYGAGYFNGGVNTSGADFAESVRVDRPAGEFEPGDVVVIDAAAVRQFSMSTEAMSPLVAGVVSTKPALLGSTHKVASMSPADRTAWKAREVELGIVGIVPTKVCDEGGPIRAGDLLVTASIPGHARRAPANPAPGTVLGKALAPLDRGRGKVEVLLISR